MGIIAIIPGFFALYFALRYSPAKAFLNVYLPVLLLLPEYYRWVVPLLPDPTFNQAAILPIFAIYWVRDRKSWRWSAMDFLMLAFAACVGISEYTNAGFKEAQNLMFDMVASWSIPYVLTKGLVLRYRMGVPLAKRLVILLFAISLISIYEFRMGVTPWQLALNRFFPGQGDGWVTTFRYGFARIAGPFGHAILAGLVLVIGYRISRWLEWSGYWEPRFRMLRDIPLPKARTITLGIALGIVMTLVRGPWLGGVAGAAITAVGLARNRKKALLILAGGVLAVGIPAGAFLYSYASVGRAAAKSDSQETAAYRKELLDKYLTIALQRGTWGWGRNTWPKIEGSPSIDNYYLLLSLMYGLIAVAILDVILVGMTVRLIRFELRSPPGPRGSSLGFTLAGIYVAITITIGTVYLGLTMVPLFAVLTGWSEAYLLAGKASEGKAIEAAPGAVLAARRFAFRRVVA
jgi:hypothetical protein